MRSISYQLDFALPRSTPHFTPTGRFLPHSGHRKAAPDGAALFMHRWYIDLEVNTAYGTCGNTPMLVRLLLARSRPMDDPSADGVQVGHGPFHDQMHDGVLCLRHLMPTEYTSHHCLEMTPHAH